MLEPAYVPFIVFLTSGHVYQQTAAITTTPDELKSHLKFVDETFSTRTSCNNKASYPLIGKDYFRMYISVDSGDLDQVAALNPRFFKVGVKEGTPARVDKLDSTMKESIVEICRFERDCVTKGDSNCWCNRIFEGDGGFIAFSLRLNISEDLANTYIGFAIGNESVPSGLKVTRLYGIRAKKVCTLPSKVKSKKNGGAEVVTSLFAVVFSCIIAASFCFE